MEGDTITRMDQGDLTTVQQGRTAQLSHPRRCASSRHRQGRGRDQRPRPDRYDARRSSGYRLRRDAVTDERDERGRTRPSKRHRRQRHRPVGRRQRYRDQFVAEHSTGLYALDLQVTDLEMVRADLASDGIGPVGEISAGSFTGYLSHPRDFEARSCSWSEFPHAYETGGAWGAGMTGFIHKR